MAPNSANGKICYLEIPSSGISTSSASYEEVFGWKLRTRGDGVEQAVTVIGNMTIARFRDPAGNVMGLKQQDRHAHSHGGHRCDATHSFPESSSRSSLWSSSLASFCNGR